MTNFLIILLALIINIFIYWFFFGKKEEYQHSTNSKLEIRVEGGYNPSVLKIKKGSVAKITFYRVDKNTCLEEVIFPDFKIKKYLPVGKKVVIEIKPTEKGEFRFNCGMNMFHGKIVVY